MQDFALEAGQFSRTGVLQREIRVFLHGINSNQNLLGSITYCPSRNVRLEAADLEVDLVSKGVAKVKEEDVAICKANLLLSEPSVT